MQVLFSPRSPFFSLVTKNDDEPWHSSSVFLFCFCAMRKDDDKLMLVIVFFCFVSLHPEKTMTSWCLSSSFFVLFLCTQRRQQRADACRHLVLFCFYALVFMRPNGCFVSIWSKHTPFECKPENQSVHLFILGGLSNKITILWMLIFWTTRMQGKNRMRKRPLIKWKRKWN